MEESNVDTEHSEPLGDYSVTIRIPGKREYTKTYKTRKGQGTIYWNKGNMRLRSTIRNCIWFFRKWAELGKPEWVSINDAARGVGVGRGVLLSGIGKAHDYKFMDHLVREGDKILAASVIEQIMWIPAAEAAYFCNFTRKVFWDHSKIQDFSYEYREFRRCVCVRIDDILSIAIWDVVRKASKKSMPFATKDGISALDVDAITDLVKSLGGANAIK